jgi:hypothetical protein
MNIFKRTSRIETLKAIYEDYKANPRKFMDMENPVYEDEDNITFARKPLHEVMGLERLGSGVYSVVYALDDRKVLKIVKDEDQGYASFVKFIQSRGRKFSAFPKVYYSGEWAGHAVYILERMETPSDENEVDRLFLVELVQNYVGRRGRKGHKPSRFLSIPADFVEAMEALNEWYKENNSNRDAYSFGLDIHSENVLIRPNGQPVVTDPFS